MTAEIRPFQDWHVYSDDQQQDAKLNDWTKPDTANRTYIDLKGDTLTENRIKEGELRLDGHRDFKYTIKLWNQYNDGVTYNPLVKGNQWQNVSFINAFQKHEVTCTILSWVELPSVFADEILQEIMDLDLSNGVRMELTVFSVLAVKLHQSPISRSYHPSQKKENQDDLVCEAANRLCQIPSINQKLLARWYSAYQQFDRNCTGAKFSYRRKPHGEDPSLATMDNPVPPTSHFERGI